MVLSLNNSVITATIGTQGAELLSISQNNQNYLWQVNQKYWNKTSPILFPIVGQLKDNTYYYNQQCYTMPRHGFARNYNFSVIKKSNTSLTLQLTDNLETQTMYPFCFVLQITYTLQQNKLLTSYQIYNQSNQKMPFCIGAHPAFAINGPIENYSLHFKDSDFLITNVLQDGLISLKTKTIPLRQNILPLSYNLFTNDALVCKKIKSKRWTLLKNDCPEVQIYAPNFSDLGIWTKKDAPFLCIEPWIGYADNTNSTQNLLDKDSIIILDPDQQYSTWFEIIINPIL